MKEFLDYPIIETGKYALRVSNLLGLAILVLTLLLTLYLIRRLIFRSQRFDISKKYALYRLCKYFLTVIAFVLGFQILGFNVSILLAGSAALLVGLGLGIQSLFSDVISGIIILIDGTVKVNDVIDVNGIICQVKDINFRTTTVLTRDDKYIILPNSEFTKNRIVNWTHSEIISRFEISIGVDYSSDIHQVQKILQQVSAAHPSVMKSPEPFVRFTECADSSLIFTIFFWAEEVFRVENIKSEIRVSIFDAFKKEGIQIPFPQRVVHIKEP
ncbi:MAG: mechanosensitive ion channel [Bacteroidetes bacterium]|nr:mechanosensitive ion channel [Bacteroidota bacterium]MBU1719168.1 mechanosensitive ion channel [Bacteroidota bacterium]